MSLQGQEASKSTNGRGLYFVHYHKTDKGDQEVTQAVKSIHTIALALANSEPKDCPYNGPDSKIEVMDHEGTEVLVHCPARERFLSKRDGTGCLHLHRKATKGCPYVEEGRLAVKGEGVWPLTGKTEKKKEVSVQ